MEKPTLYVCHGDTKSPRLHPCGKVQKAMQEKGIEYDKVLGGKGNPIPFLRSDDARKVIQEETGQDNLPTLKLPDGTLIPDSKKILEWVEAQP
jgi:hypothetical protein